MQGNAGAGPDVFAEVIADEGVATNEGIPRVRRTLAF